MLKWIYLPAVLQPYLYLASPIILDQSQTTWRRKVNIKTTEDSGQSWSVAQEHIRRESNVQSERRLHFLLTSKEIKHHVWDHTMCSHNHDTSSALHSPLVCILHVHINTLRFWSAVSHLLHINIRTIKGGEQLERSNIQCPNNEEPKHRGNQEDLKN